MLAMHVLNCRDFLLPIADERSELDDWTIAQCQDWLCRNDPNGCWETLEHDYLAWELQDECWAQMRGV
jgi:hypothetical protein